MTVTARKPEQQTPHNPTESTNERKKPSPRTIVGGILAGIAMVGGAIGGFNAANAEKPVLPTTPATAPANPGATPTPEISEPAPTTNAENEQVYPAGYLDNIKQLDDNTFNGIVNNGLIPRVDGYVLKLAQAYRAGVDMDTVPTPWLSGKGAAAVRESLQETVKTLLTNHPEGTPQICTLPVDGGDLRACEGEENGYPYGPYYSSLVNFSKPENKTVTGMSSWSVVIADPKPDQTGYIVQKNGAEEVRLPDNYLVHQLPDGTIGIAFGEK